jgi:hypothetical protein
VSLEVLLWDFYQEMRRQDAAAAAAMAELAEDRRREHEQARSAFNWTLLRFVVNLPATGMLFRALKTPRQTWAYWAQWAALGDAGWMVLLFLALWVVCLWGDVVDLVDAAGRYYFARRRSMILS